MKIAYISDIHEDAGLLGRAAAKLLPELVHRADPDVFIIGGDVASSLHTLDRFLAGFARMSCPKLFVPGNHDVWVSHASEKGLTSWDKYHRLIPEICGKNGFHYLPKDPVVIGGIGYAGTLGWYDYSFRNLQFDDVISPSAYRRRHYKGRVWNDRRYVAWNQPDDEVTLSMALELDGDLSKLDGRCDKVVAVSHHLPFVEMVKRSGKPEWDFFNAYMGSELLGQVIRRHPEVTLVLSGHTHYKVDLVVDGVRAVTAPLGYAREREGEVEEIVKGSLLLVEA